MTDKPAIMRARLKERRAVHQRLVLMQTYQQIADSLMPCPRHDARAEPTCDECRPMYGSRASAQKAVVRAIQADYSAAASEREHLRDELLGTSKLLLKQAVADALDAKASRGDRARAQVAAVRVMDRMAKLVGTDAPTRVTITDELDEELRQALAELQELPMPTAAELVER